MRFIPVLLIVPVVLAGGLIFVGWLAGVLFKLGI
jgi:hypothetical protein